MVRKALLFSATVFAMTACTPKAPDTSADVAAVNAAIRAFLATDIAGTKAAGYIDKDGDVTGAGASGDLGWVSGAYILTDSAGKVVDQGKYTTLYRRVGSGWKIIRDTWNTDTAPSPAPPAVTPAVPPKA